MTPILQASIDAAKARHPSGKAMAMTAPLTAADRCDRCSAAAAYRIQKTLYPDALLDPTVMDVPTPTLTLDFCGHHWRHVAADMYAEGWKVTAANADVAREPASELEGTPS